MRVLILENKNFNQLSLMDQFFPNLFKLDGELARVDEILSDERFLEPFIEHFRTTCGRPTVPVDVYLRMMYLKKRYNLGYETLCKEVSDSISCRLFSHIRLEEKVPDYTTLAKLTKKYGEKTLEKLNSLLIEKAKDEKLIRSRKVRVDTTVVESNIHHPTDADLLSDGVRVITRMVKKVKEIGHAAKAEFSDRTRAIKRRILSMVKFGKTRAQKAKEEVKGKVKEIVKITREVVDSAIKVSTMAKAEIAKAKDIQVARAKRFVKKLDETISVMEKVIHQTEEVLSGVTSIPDRVVSIFDQKARPIRRGKAKADTEFGRKVVLTESEEKLIISYKVLEGNPSDKGQAVPAIKKAKEVLGRAPGEMAADRGFFSKENEVELHELGVRRVAIPKPGKKSARRKEFERQHWFRRLKRWRSGEEGTISLLKRKYGLERCLLRGDDGTGIWVGLSVFAHNLDKLARMVA